MIYICSLESMERNVRELRPRHLVSVLQEDEQPPTPPEISRERHFRLEIDDITQPAPGLVVPQPDHIESLIHFLSSCDRDSSILFHCIAGLSRSPAAALIALVLHAEGREDEAARILRRAAPHVFPNRRMIELADGLLGRGGRLVAALDAMEPGELFTSGPLVELPRRLDTQPQR
jgi:predicted protein tyrosine phosphatase